MPQRKKVFRFRGRSVADASRKAARELGEDAVVLDVRFVPGEGGRSCTEMLVTQQDRVGIPSMMAFLAGPEPDDPRTSTETTIPATAAAMAAAAGGVARWPARYERVRRTLRQLGVAAEPATQLCRQAWHDDAALDALPWESVRGVLERQAPCSPPLDLTRLQVLGIVGHPFTGRSTVAGGICRMAAEIVPQRVALLTSQEPVMPGDAVEVFGYESPDAAARSLARIPDLRLAVVDLPTPQLGERRLGLEPWLSMFPEMTLVPVLDAIGQRDESLALLEACAPLQHTGWIMTGVDEDAQLGHLLDVALIGDGPLGIQGKEPRDVPRMRLARWDELITRMSRHEVDDPARSDEAVLPLAQSTGGTV